MITAQEQDYGSTSGRVVPTEGLEPPHLAAHGPEPCASTNSATWALVAALLHPALPPTCAIILGFAVLRQINFRYRRAAPPDTLLIFACNVTVAAKDQNYRRNNLKCQSARHGIFRARYVRRIPRPSVTLRISPCQYIHCVGNHCACCAAAAKK